ncbi:aspartate aminotransferase [Gloeothece verrucosa]|uniref:Aminotransferase class I and II n=1 Tax=Gloeothece verrucosa (strain PCC 7822) TaxID=497965 RepID=E0U6H9_GLOV7|nr:aspartate aminotransferase [Gloeothece verrucosa]ADN13622.1 aminotransferase class I and II [Gloeothece verrucosa PCC 7822]
MTVDWIKSRADRLRALPPYVFARLDELKARAREQGLDLIDLGMGNPDGSAPQPVIDAAVTALAYPPNHGYPPFEGTASFRKAITCWYQRHYGVDLDPDSEALPLLGSKEGLAHLALAYVNPGDLILVPSPSYPAHFRGPMIAGANLYPIPLSAEQDWLIDLSSIPEQVAQKAKIFYFNYPNNPTAATAPREFFEEIVDFARHYEIMLVHDLAYAEIAFDGYEPTSLLEIPGAKEIGVEFHTMSKTYNMAGWRVGFVVGNSDIIQGLRTLKTNLDYGIFSVVQKAAETALGLPQEYITRVQQRYQQRRDFLISGLAELGWKIPPTKATMYLWVPVTVGMTSTDFALNVLQTTGVVVTPGNAFGEAGEGFVRVSLIAELDRLGEALRRLKQAGIRYQSEVLV